MGYFWQSDDEDADRVGTPRYYRHVARHRKPTLWQRISVNIRQEPRGPSPEGHAGGRVRRAVARSR